ncbi:unnamed protein product, partial [Mesorhabditis belari]|uniref:Fatty acid hydroxylase domain-containing protein n=1 Tax=Mesorhabditis belari TaxID=2138241 RepID=A0AAF3EXV1_9BILA
MWVLERLAADLHPTNLRPLFYLVTPNETMHYKSIEEVPNLLENSNLWMLLLVLIEFYFLDDRKYAFNDTITSINAGILSLLMKFGGRYMSAALYPWFFSHFRIIDLDPHSSTTWMICFFTQDLCYYLAHRAIHEFGVFWSFHQMHHSSEYYNLSTALRQGMWQDFGTFGFDLLQSFFIPPNIFIVHRYMNVAYQFWLHTELVPYLGPFEWFFNTPSSHRVHHGRNPYCIDRNYGGTLIIWDRLFGTYEAERSDEKIAYGLVTNVETFDQLWCQTFEFKALGYDKGQMKDEKGKEIFPGFWEKLKCVFMPPGYFPGVRTRWFFFWKCVEDNTEGIPEINEVPVPYNQPLSTPLKLYLTVQFTVTVVLAIYFNEVRVSLNWPSFFAYFSYLLASIQAFGYYFDHRPFCVLFDCARLLALIYFGFMAQSGMAFIFGGLSAATVIALGFAGQMPVTMVTKKLD